MNRWDRINESGEILRNENINLNNNHSIEADESGDPIQINNSARNGIYKIIPYIYPVIFGVIGMYITGPKIWYAFKYATFAYILFYIIKNRIELIKNKNHNAQILLVFIVFIIIILAWLIKKYVYLYPERTGFVVAAYITMVLIYLLYPTINDKSKDKLFITVNILIFLLISLSEIYQINSNTLNIQAEVLKKNEPKYLRIHKNSDSKKKFLVKHKKLHKDNLITTNRKLFRYISPSNSVLKSSTPTQLRSKKRVDIEVSQKSYEKQIQFKIFRDTTASKMRY